ncbi:MAG: hypothetical protein HY547_06975 [Elusimicrobia bacterium]|nr:hypothetical protein [Elusimicrobiota bacterium]
MMRRFGGFVRSLDKIFLLFLFVWLILNWISLPWGLPSVKRAAMVLPPESKEPQFFEQLETNRKKLYEISLSSQIAVGWMDPYFSRPDEIFKVRGWETPWHRFLLHAYSGFLLRSIDGDEQIFIVSLSKMNPKKLQLNPHHYFHAGVYIYSLGALFQASQMAGLIRLVSDIKFYYSHPDDMGRFYHIGRIYSALWGIIGGILLYILVLKNSNRRMASLAAYFYLAAPVTLYVTHVLKGHATGAALVFGLLILCHDILERGTKKSYGLASLLAGIIVGTQPHLWFAALTVPLAHLCHGLWVDRVSIKKIFIDLRFLLMPVIGILGFVLVSPYIFSAFKEWYYVALVHGSDIHPPTLNPLKWLKAYAIGLGIGLNYPVFLAFAIGLIWALCRWVKRTSWEKFLIIFSLAYLLLFGIYTGPVIQDSAMYSRHFMPLVGLCCCWAAWSLERCFGSGKYYWKGLGAFIVLYALSVMIFYEFNYFSDARGSSYMKAGEWISKNIPKRSSIGLKHMPHTDFTPPFDFVNYELWINVFNNHLDPEKDALPQYYVLERNPNYYSVPIEWKKPFKNFERYYDPVAYFGRGGRPRWWDFTDHFSGANFPVWIYQLRRTHAS